LDVAAYALLLSADNLRTRRPPFVVENHALTVTAAEVPPIEPSVAVTVCAPIVLKVTVPLKTP
jgi:hypothetical protein